MSEDKDSKEEEYTDLSENTVRPSKPADLHHENHLPTDAITSKETSKNMPPISSASTLSASSSSQNPSQYNTISSNDSNSFSNSNNTNTNNIDNNNNRRKKGSGMNTIQRNRRGVSSRYHGVLSDNNANNNFNNGNNTLGSRLRTVNIGTSNNFSNNNNRSDTLIYSNGSNDFSYNNSHITNRNSTAGDAFLPTSFHSSLRNSSLNKNTGSNSYAATMNNRFKVHMRQNIRLPSSAEESLEFNQSNMNDGNNNLIHRINRMQQVSKNDENEDEEMLRISNSHGGNSVGNEDRRPLIISAQLKHLLPKAYIQHHSKRSDNSNINSDRYATQSRIQKLLYWTSDFISSTSNDKNKSFIQLSGSRQYNDNESINSSSTIMVNMKNKFVCGLVIMFLLVTILVINITSDPEYFSMGAREKVNQEGKYKRSDIKVNRNETKGKFKNSTHIDDDFIGEESFMVKGFLADEASEKKESTAKIDKENAITLPAQHMPSSTNGKKSQIKNVENDTNNTNTTLVTVPSKTEVEPEIVSNAIKVRYYLPIFTCYPREKNMLSPNVPLNDAQFHDAAAVLKQSIHENSIRNPNSDSKYDYEMVALIHPDVITCEMSTSLESFVLEGESRIDILRSLGYTVQVVKEPIEISAISQKITSDFYLYMMVNPTEILNFILLHALKSNLPVGVLVELTTIVMKPPDTLLDLIVKGNDAKTISLDSPSLDAVTKTVFPNGKTKQMTALPNKIDFVYSKDYSGIVPKQWEAGISTAFFVFRPSFDTFHLLIDVLKSGHYTNDFGWGGLGYGPFAGSRGARGLLTYFVQETLFDNSVEVHRCTFNNRATIPTLTIDQGENICRDIKEKEGETCTDCRETPIKSIVVANIGSCVPPWACLYQKPLNAKDASNFEGFVKTKEMCQFFYQKWYDFRKKFESMHSDVFSTETPTGKYQVDKFQGYCEKEFQYLPMRLHKKEIETKLETEV